MALPRFYTSDQDLALMQNSWAAQLNPILANPTTNLSILKDIPLVSGANVINHKLGKAMQGWVILDLNAPVTIYRSAAFNNLTLTLTSSGTATVNIGVF